MWMGQAGHVDGLLGFSGEGEILTRRSSISVERPKFPTGKPRITLVLLARNYFSRIHSTVQVFICWYTVTRILTSHRVTLVKFYTDITETEK